MKIPTMKRTPRALRPPFQAIRWIVAAALVTLASAACDVHSPVGPGEIASLTLSPGQTTMAINSTQQLTARAFDAEGREVSISGPGVGSSTVWEMVNGGGTLDNAGVFHAGTELGTFSNTVRVRVGGREAFASFTVIAGPVAAIVVTPNPDTLAVGITRQFTATGVDMGGNPVPITPTWSVVNGGGAINASTGMFTAGTMFGTFNNTIRATSGIVSGFATVTVASGPAVAITVSPSPASLGVNGTQQFTATAVDASGNPASITPTWSVVSGGGAINASTGMFTAGTTTGTFTNTVRATSGSLAGSATVTVTSGPAVAITVSPTPATVGINGTQQFTATAVDASGNPASITPTWSVVSGGGTISASTGMFTAGTTTGTFTNTVRATSGSLTGSATVHVTGGSASVITVSPNPGIVGTSGTRQFTATAEDSSGNEVSITPVWSVEEGGGTIDASTGMFTAGATTGTFTNTVRATSGEAFGSATVNVTSGPAAVITVSPDPAELAVDGTQQFTATAVDASGNPASITPVWSVEEGGGTIDASTGVFTAGATTGTFTNTVRATSGDLFGSATVTVTSGSAAVITVSPDPAELATNATQEFTATAEDSAGNTVEITPVWSVEEGGGEIDSETGIFTAGDTEGTFANTVRATSGDLFGSATVTVTSGSTLVITVSPDSVGIATNGTREFTATAEDGAGNTVEITPEWSVEEGGGTIDALTGVFTAGTDTGTFTNTVRATSDGWFGSATVTVTAAMPLDGVLGAAAPNGIMAGTEVTCVDLGLIEADVSIYPGNTITGYPPCEITGVQNLGNELAEEMQIDLTTAYNELAGLPCPPANAIVANLGGTTLPAGVYCSDTEIGVTGTLTLDGGGDPDAVFVFQAGSSLTTAGDIVLIGEAQAQNVYWQVGSSATLGTASQWQGNIVALTSITLVDTATLLGRALARNGAVSLGTDNSITLP